VIDCRGLDVVVAAIRVGICLLFKDRLNWISAHPFAPVSLKKFQAHRIPPSDSTFIQRIFNLLSHPKFSGPACGALSAIIAHRS
jgi:hypothetical protein